MEPFLPLVPGVYRQPVPFTGCWTGVALVTGDLNILIDTGASAETVDSDIVPGLAALGLTPADLDWIALTHTHGDHVGGCARLKALAPDAGVACFAGSRERVLDPLRYSKAIRAAFPEHSPAAPATLKGVAPTLLLMDGDRLGPLRLIHTPGHDTDSCCYLDERTATLITGDSLQLNGTVAQGCALLMDAAGYGHSLERLLGMDVQNIVCGHPYLPLGAEAIGPDAARAYLLACLSCLRHDEGFVRGMMAAGVSDPVRIARALVAEVGGRLPAHLFLPLFTVTDMMKGGQPL